MTEAFVFRSALADFMRPKRVLVWLVVAAALGLIGALFVRVNRVGSEEAYAMLSSLLVFRLLPLASAIFSTAVLSQEVEQKTIVYLLTRPVRRSALLLLRTLASALVVFVVASMAAVAVSVAVYGRGGLANPVLTRDLVAIGVGSLAYGALFVLVSLLVNRAMIVNLLFAFAWETSVSAADFGGNLHWLSVTSYLTAIAQRPSIGKPDVPMGSFASNLGTNTIDPRTGWVVAIALIAICAALGAWWFTRFEYLPREDAE